MAELVEAEVAFGAYNEVTAFWADERCTVHASWRAVSVDSHDIRLPDIAVWGGDRRVRAGEREYRGYVRGPLLRLSKKSVVIEDPDGTPVLTLRRKDRGLLVHDAAGEVVAVTKEWNVDLRLDPTYDPHLLRLAIALIMGPCVGRLSGSISF